MNGPVKWAVQTLTASHSSHSCCMCENAVDRDVYKIQDGLCILLIHEELCEYKVVWLVLYVCV